MQLRRMATPVALAFVSLVAAVALWVAVTDAENPTSPYDFPGAITVRAVNVPQGLAVASIAEGVVFVRVSATEDVHEELTTADFVAEVNLAGEREGTHPKSIVVRVVNRDDVEIISVTPSTVQVTLEAEATKQVPVLVNRQGTPQQGVVISAIEATPSSVRVTGASSLVQRAESAVVDLNLTGLRLSQTQQYTLTARDASGGDLRPLRIEPSAAEVRVTASQVELSWAVTVHVQTRGTVAPGYRLVEITPDPPLITIRGPLEQAQSLTFLPTEEVDLSNLRANQTRSVRLQVPANVRPNRDSVNLTLRIEPIIGEYGISVAPVLQNVGAGLRPALQTPSILVYVRGPVPTLQTLGGGSVRASVNLEGLQEGVHIVDAAITAPQGLEITSAEPRQVVVVLTRE